MALEEREKCRLPETDQPGIQPRDDRRGPRLVGQERHLTHAFTGKNLADRYQVSVISLFENTQAPRDQDKVIRVALALTDQHRPLGDLDLISQGGDPSELAVGARREQGHASKQLDLGVLAPTAEGHGADSSTPWPQTAWHPGQPGRYDARPVVAAVSVVARGAR